MGHLEVREFKPMFVCELYYSAVFIKSINPLHAEFSCEMCLALKRIKVREILLFNLVYFSMKFHEYAMNDDVVSLGFQGDSRPSKLFKL